MVPLEGDAPRHEREQGVVPALFRRFVLCPFSSVLFSPSFLSLHLTLSPQGKTQPAENKSASFSSHHADPGPRVHPRPALPHDDRARPRRRAAAELDAEHFWELVAPVAGRAALLLRGAVFVCFVGGFVFVCWSCVVVEGEGVGR